MRTVDERRPKIDRGPPILQNSSAFGAAAAISPGSNLRTPPRRREVRPSPWSLPSMTTPILLAWSGGKDCLLALQQLLADPAWQVVGLLTTVNRHYRRIAMHGVQREVLLAQTAALGLPLIEVPLDWPGSNEAYEEAHAGALAGARMRWPGIRHCAFGDLFLEDVRDYRVRQLGRENWRAVFPLWGVDTVALARRFAAWIPGNWTPATAAALTMRPCSTRCPPAWTPAASAASFTRSAMPARCSATHSSCAAVNRCSATGASSSPISCSTSMPPRTDATSCPSSGHPGRSSFPAAPRRAGDRRPNPPVTRAPAARAGAGIWAPWPGPGRAVPPRRPALTKVRSLNRLACADTSPPVPEGPPTRDWSRRRGCS